MNTPRSSSPMLDGDAVSPSSITPEPRCARCGMPATAAGALMPDPNGSLCPACYERKATAWVNDLFRKHFAPVQS